MSASSSFCKDFDDLLPVIGEFGKYQKLLVVCMIPFTFLFAYNYLGPIFLTLVPRDYWCTIPELSSLSNDEQRKLGIPKDENGEYDKCRRYDVNFTEVLITKAQTNDSWRTTTCSDGWTYDRSEVPYDSIATEYNWVCDDDKLIGSTVSLFFVGSILGGIIFGYAADRFGRVPALMTSNMAALAGGIIAASARNFIQFALTRVLIGSAFDSSFTLIYILALEYVGLKYRTVVANLCTALFFTPGACTLPWVARACSNWRIISLVISLPIIILLLMYFILPESARWLISVGRIDEAIIIMQRAAKINGKTIPPELLKTFRVCCQLEYEASRGGKDNTVWHLFKRRRIRKHTLLLISIWMITSLLYDVHIRIIVEIGPDVFITFSLANLTELPAGIIPVLILDRIGRRCTSVFIFISCALFSLIAAVCHNTYLVVIFASIGRLFATMAFNVVLQWMAEILPTPVRAQGISIIHITGYLASILSPVIMYANHYGYLLDVKILSILSISAAALSLFLPETLNEDLPQSMEEAEDLGREQRFFSFLR